MRKYPMTMIATISNVRFWRLFLSSIFSQPFELHVKWVRFHVIFCWNLAKARIKTKAYSEIYKL